MSTRYDFQITDNGDVVVLLPGGALCDFSQHGRSDERIAQAAFRQMIADIASITAERDAYRASSEIRGANLEDMNKLLSELSAHFASHALDCRRLARDLRMASRNCLDCSA